MDEQRYRHSSLYDTTRIDWLIEVMCRDFSMTKQEIIDDLQDISNIPIDKKLDLISEIWMTYS